VPKLTTALLLGFIVNVLAGCGSDGDRAAPTATPPPAIRAEQASTRGPYGVGVTTIELVDASRTTAPNRDYVGAPMRTLPVEIWYPAVASAEAEVVDAPVEVGGAPFPLIVFAHGFSALRRQSASYTQHLASHGYVVVSPDFPGSNIAAAGGPRLHAVLDQPADVSFVIDELFARDGEVGWLLAGAIDEERVGMTGHSLGGVTTMLTAYGDRADERIDAIVPISPPGCLLPEDLAAGSDIPAMVVGGSSEIIVSPSWIAYAYEIARAPKYYVSIIGGDHIRFADVDTTDSELPGIVDQVGGGDRQADAIQIITTLGADGTRCLERDEITDELVGGGRQRELLRTVALPFFNAYLKGDPSAQAFLREVLPSLEGIRLKADTGETEGAIE
jgi:predicted dienelactone hydrolase